MAAGCFLPLSDNLEISRDMGTRHRSALGMSENSDAIVVVVSEETGIISLAKNGVMIRRLDRQNLYSLYSGQYYYRVQSGWWLNRGSPATYIRGLTVFALLFLLCYAALKAVWLEYTQRKSFFVLAMVVIFVLSLAYYSHFDGIITDLIDTVGRGRLPRMEF